MATFLFVVPPLTGHINPLLPVAEDLAKKGHFVAWAGHTEVVSQHIPASQPCFPLPSNESTFVDENWHKVRGLESVKFFYEYFCLPMALRCLAPLEKIVDELNPDVIFCDHQMIAGALVARKKEIPWVSSVTTTASILKLLDVIDNWLADKLADLQKAYGMKQIVERPDFSDYGCVVFSSQALIGQDKEYFDAPYHFVGPAINQRRKPTDFPWEKLEDNKRKILISLGTVNRDRCTRFYDIMIEALKDEDVQVIMVAPENYEAEIPDNFIVQSRVPQLELLSHVNLVVSHAGHNTVCETLSHAKPLVVSPIRDDQSVIARQVVDAGAGLSLRFGKVSVAKAKQTIFSVLDDPSYLLAAARIQRSFEPLQGSKQAALVLESLLDPSQERVYANG
ncbi:Demethyllactenocin mycarosyltransferase [Thalassocella blandensis]|nr:Demethyllactenocin mycarosyltransferase [Thalassocella blandensis]